MSQDGIVYRYRFGPAEFDEARLELRVNGLVVELEHKPVQVLIQLLRRAGEVLTRAELKDTVWGGRPTVDEVLSNSILKLRKALGEDAGECIATVPRIGYKLVGTVQRVAVGHGLVSHLALSAGEPVPGRAHFVLESQLEGTRNREVWLARHGRTHERRAFKFGLDTERLLSLKREATLYRLLRETLGPRADIVQILDWNFESPPFFLECEYGGESLLRWAASAGRLQALPLEQGIGLFLQIADVVAVVHGVGVLHKDLKPANILIAPREAGGWQLRVADFGSGLLLDAGRLEELGITALGLTATAGVLGDPTSGTPLYVAPELIAGQAPTVQSDVYALGYMLYQIVVADLRQPMATGWEANISDELMREDIAAATDGRPAHRLASVAELCARLRRREVRLAERHRAEEAERRATLAERALERARARRPWLVALMVSLVVGLVVGLWLYRGEKIARHRAEQAETRAEAIVRFLNDDLLGAADPSGPGSTHETTVKEAATRAARRLAGLFQDDPETKASIDATLGQVYSGITDYASAEQYLRQAMELFRRSRGPEDQQTLRAEYLHALVLIDLNKLVDAESELDEADRRAGSRRDASSSLAFDAHMVRANLYMFQRKPQESLVEFRQADQVRAVLEPGNARLLFRVKSGISWCYLHLQRADDALRVLGGLLAPEYTVESVGPLSWSDLRIDYASVLADQGRYDEAAAFARMAIKELQATLGPDSTFTALAWNVLGDAYVAQDKFDMAQEPYQKSYEIYRARLGEEHQSTLIALGNLGILEYKTGHLQQAAVMLSDLHRKLLQAPNTPDSVLQCVSFYLASAAIEGNLGTVADSASLTAHLDPKVIEAVESGKDWEQRLQALQGEIQLRQGRQAEGLALLMPAIAKMRQDGVTPTILEHYLRAVSSIKH